MVGTFEDLEEVTESEQSELYQAKHSVDKIFLDVYNSSAGRVMFEYLQERFVDIQIARPGDTTADIYTRQGKADLIRMMQQAVDDALTTSH